MPELPEVETVCHGVRQRLAKLGHVTCVKPLRANLRVPIPRQLHQRVSGQALIAVRRRAKYILFDTQRDTIISHLGMSGSWRFSTSLDLIKHDHLYIEFSSGLKLIFNDPRRFGFIDLYDRQSVNSSRWLKSLGVEPLEALFTVEHMCNRARGRRTPIKNFIMDQKIIVGVGNIYASEALFMAGIRPQRRSDLLKSSDWHRLIEAIRLVLKNAIASSGTTLRNYRQSDGAKGEYKQRLAVYDRYKEACCVCSRPIKRVRMGGRSTYWCSQCQK